ncbi:transcriptional regulator [Lactiplantibacillus brownii]|uniref:transcriptional regulator n=1 Tax=Lactiplantibacillus brownii TaxID=3069269 RepID=UPI0038B31AF2
MTATKQKVIVNKDALISFLADQNMSIIDLASRMGTAPSTVYRSIDDSNPKGVGGETIASMLSALGFEEKDFPKLFIFTNRCI